MNCRGSLGSIALLLCLVSYVNAQQPPALNRKMPIQPALFEKIPNKVICPISHLDHFFSSEEITIAESPLTFNSRITIISNTHPDPSVQTVNMRLEKFPGALFTLSRVKLEGGSVKYVGHVASMDHSDILELQFENGAYYFVKKERRLVVTE